MPANKRLPHHQLKYLFSFSLTLSLVFSISQVSLFSLFSFFLTCSLPLSSPLTHTFLLYLKSNPIKSFKAISPSPSQLSETLFSLKLSSLNSSLARCLWVLCGFSLLARCLWVLCGFSLIFFFFFFFCGFLCIWCCRGGGVLWG